MSSQALYYLYSILLASRTRITTNQENVDSRTRDNGPSHEGSHIRDNTLHYQNKTTTK
jgi:hypothetical protein